MKQLTKEQLSVIERQMFNHTRDVDTAIYDAMFFDDFPKEIAVDALLMYQNKDGGFGSGLHIDIYSPDSSVYVTYEALKILYMVGFRSMKENELLEGLLNKAFNYLYNRNTLKDNKFEPLEKTNNKYAHSKKFELDENTFERFGYYPSVTIFGFTLLFCDETKAYYKKALNYAKKAISDFYISNAHTKDELYAYSLFIECLRYKNLLIEELDKLENSLLEYGLSVVSRDVSAYEEEDAVRPTLIFAHLNLNEEAKELLERDLDYIIDSIASHGLWDHKSDWDEDKYPEASSASLKWIGVESYRNLYLLKKFNRF